MKNRINYMLAVSAVILCLNTALLSAEAGGKIIATNSWTAAFVSAAGAEAEQIASSDMTHPPEYELKPSDVIKIRDADLLVYAGYEIMMKSVFESFPIPADRLLKINTGYAPGIVEQSVAAIAEKTGTMDRAKQFIREYKEEFASCEEKLKKSGLYGAPVIVNFHHKLLAEAFGFKVLAVFGPAPLEVSRLASLGTLKPVLIIDNAHNPIGAPLGEITGAGIIELVNFPGFTEKNGTVCPGSLKGILLCNTDKLIKR